MTGTRTTTWVDQQTLTAAALNAEFDNLLNAVAIVNADISSGAAIVYSKLSLTGGIVNADISASAAIAGTKIGTALASKTMSAMTVVNSAQTLVTASDGATVTFDLSAGNVQSVTLAGNRTLALSNATNGQAFVIRLIQDGTGSRTVTWFSGISWPNAIVPTLTTTATKSDTFGFICTSAGAYLGFIVGQNM